VLGRVYFSNPEIPGLETLIITLKGKKCLTYSSKDGGGVKRIAQMSRK